MDEPKRSPGRPRIDNGESAHLHIRISEDRKARYEAAAKRAGKKVAAWAKGVLDRASRR
jgi:hypothetical protein